VHVDAALTAIKFCRMFLPTNELFKISGVDATETENRLADMQLKLMHDINASAPQFFPQGVFAVNALSGYGKR
jgi:hypothetical protein